jgi:hypothetical protein
LGSSVEARYLDEGGVLEDPFLFILHISHAASITGKPTGECIGQAQCAGRTGSDKPTPWAPVKDLWLVRDDAGARAVGKQQAAGSALYVGNLVG